jgi:hypothetical protein
VGEYIMKRPPIRHYQHRTIVLRALLTFGVAVVFVVSLGTHAAESSGQIDEATRIGQQVLAIKAALDNPGTPDAMQAVMDLGTDSRYYVMVRGWLSLQLKGDRNIANASQGEVSPEIERRIEFLEQAIRAIDLE